MSEVSISEVQVIPVKAQNGLVAFASCVLNDQFYIGNIAVYTSPSSLIGFRLVFPNKKLSSGCIIDCFHPISKAAGEYITSAIIDKYLKVMRKF